MLRLKNILWSAAAIICAVLTTAYAWWQLVLHPATTYLEQGGDSSKNYYTFLYHSLYGKGWWFTGMNYPYGEHIVYVDGQPAFSMLLAALRSSLSLTPDLSMATLHLLILVSFALAIIFIYLLLVHFKMSPGFAIIFACLIIILSPQVDRVFGHFGLSYISVIPMQFYWLVKYNATNRKWYLMYFLVAGCITSFVHPYFTGVAFLWTFFYSIAYFILEKRTVRDKLKHVGSLLLMAIIVVFIVKLVMAVTDPVTDRTNYPYGTLSACTTGMDIFTSQRSGIWQFLQEKKIVTETSSGREGFTYLGIVPIIVVIISIVGLVITKLRKDKHAQLAAANTLVSPIWLLVALFAVLLGMGVPFVWQMDWLLDYVSLFRQFRSLGRFSWIFYYIATVYSALVLYGWVIKKNNEGKAQPLVILVFILALAAWLFEAKGSVDYVHKRLENGHENYKQAFSKNEGSWMEFFKSINRTPSDFQAIILLPNLHNGSEKLWIYDDPAPWLYVLAIRPSLQTGMPMVAVNMSRTSWSQTFANVRMSGGPLADKPLFRTGDERPFLVLVYKSDTLADINNRYLLAAGDSLGSHGDVKVYQLHPARLRAKDLAYRDSMMAVYDAMHNGDSCTIYTGPWYAEHFDQGRGKEVLFGKGAAAAVTGSLDIPVDMIKFTPTYHNQVYEFSAWVRVNDKDYRSPHFEIECRDSTGALLNVGKSFIGHSLDNYDFWFRAHHYFKVPGNTTNLRVILLSNGNTGYVALDEILIRPLDATIISKNSDGSSMVNNHIYIRK